MHGKERGAHSRPGKRPAPERPKRTERPDLRSGRRPDRRPERGGRLPVALVFPGPEALALSTLGWQVVWRLLSAMPELAVERFYLDDSPTPPRSVEYGSPLGDFPCIAVSLNFEEEARGLVAGLLAAGVDPRRGDRPGWPLVLAGGPLAWLNPAPLAPVVDLYCVAEAEAVTEHTTEPWLLGLLRELAAHWLDGGEKSAFLEQVAQREGLYAPDITLRQVARRPGPGSLLAEPAHSAFVSPAAQFKDMLLLEVNRGCPYGCRFCAAGYLYRPPRQARLEDLQAIVRDNAPRKVGLVGTALTDWPDLLPFLRWLHERKVKFSLSSVRADGLTEELLTFLRTCGVRTITLALEAASRRLRRAAGKRLREADFLAAVERCSRLGVNHLKSYLIVGWPGESDADYAEFGEFLGRLDTARRAGKGLEIITMSVNPLVPKPWTPLQWAPMATEAALDARLEQLRALVKPWKGLRLEAEGLFSARLQGYLARAGAEAYPFIETAARLGGWRKAQKQLDTDFSPVLDQQRGQDEAFPWEVVSPGVSRELLWREWQRYWQALEVEEEPGGGEGLC